MQRSVAAVVREVPPFKNLLSCRQIRVLVTLLRAFTLCFGGHDGWGIEAEFGWTVSLLLSPQAAVTQWLKLALS